MKKYLTSILLLCTSYLYAQNGVNCSTPYVINSAPFSATGLTTSGFGNDYSSADACGSAYMDGEDFVFEYIPTHDTCITVNISGVASTTGVFIIENCPSDTSAVCIGSDIGTLPSVGVKVSQSAVYYIVISTDTATSSTNFNIDLQEVDCSSIPTIQDCAGAIPLCSFVYEELDSYIGIGNVNNEFSTVNTCIGTSGVSGDVEVNSVWYTFKAVGSGNVNFTITPNDLNDDYDWAIFDITGPTNSCANLHSTGSLSCNFSGTAGPTGPNGLSGPQNEPVFPTDSGKSYAIVITNWSASTNGYTIVFDSTAGVVENGVIDFTFGGSGLNLNLVGQVSCFDLNSTNLMWMINGNQAGVGAQFDYNFEEEGTYDVCMVVDFVSYKDTVCKTIDVRRVGITEEQKNTVYVYPNPAKNVVNVKTGALADVQLVIKDLMGKVVLTEEVLSSEKGINVSDMEGGIYIYEVYTGLEKVKAGKLIIE